MGKIAKVKKGKYILLHDVPVDVQQAIIDKIQQENELCNCIRPMAHALYSIVREHTHLIGCTDAMHVVFHGHAAQASQVYHKFTGEYVELSMRIPVTSPLGAHLNYARIGKGS